jgi:GGDEF domain-containing protein
VEIVLNYLHQLTACSSKYSIAVIDLDYFIRFCIRFSDQTIERIKQSIWEFFRQEMGGYICQESPGDDQYYCVFPDVDSDACAGKIEDLRQRFRKQHFLKNIEGYEKTRMNFSAGVSGYPDHGNCLGDVIRYAIVALNQAKALRRGRVVVYPPKVQVESSRVLYDTHAEIDVVLGDYGFSGGVVEGKIPCNQVYLSEPQSIAIDENIIYIADQNTHSVLAIQDGMVKRVAGCGVFGNSENGGKADRSYLNKPTGIAVFNRILYITDTGNDQVKAVDLETGLIQCIAGCGQPGYTGDGGSATSASLNKPGGIDVDQFGNIYINDIANNVIRRVDAKGIISTYAGSGKYGFSGDGGCALSASLGEIYGLCVNRRTGDLYLADYFNHRIRVVYRNSGIIDTVIGSGTSGYSGDGSPPLIACIDRPVAVCLDKHENILIAESGNNCVRILDVTKQRVYTLAGSGKMGVETGKDIANFQFANPNGLAIGNKGEIYVLDGSNNRVCKINFRR